MSEDQTTESTEQTEEITTTGLPSSYICHNCGQTSLVDGDCPNCGAKLMGDNEALPGEKTKKAPEDGENLSGDMYSLEELAESEDDDNPQVSENLEDTDEEQI